MARHGAVRWEAADLERRERRRIQRELAAELRRRELADRPDDNDGKPILEPIHGRAGHGPVPGEFTKLWSPTRVREPQHRMTAVELAAIWPFIKSEPLPPLGGLMGLDAFSGAEFCFDPWEWYQSGRVGSTGVLLLGAYRRGKSFALKRLIARMIAFGRYVINTSDSKGEHVALAERLGGAVIRVGSPYDGTILNGLEAGHRFTGQSIEQYEVMVRTRRSLTLQLVGGILQGHELAPAQRTVLDEALDYTVAQRPSSDPTIRSVYETLLAIADGAVSVEGLPNARELAADVAIVLRDVVRGALAGMFADESTVKLDVESPYTVFDTSAVSVRGDKALELAQTISNAWVQSVLADKTSGRRYMMCREEGWRDLRSKTALQAALEQQKLAGDLGISQVFVAHEGGDFKAVGGGDSQERELAEQLLRGFSTKITFNQSAASLASAESLGYTPEDIEVIRRLRRGEFYVTAGEFKTMVDGNPITTAFERELFDTDFKDADTARLDEEVRLHDARIDAEIALEDGEPEPEPGQQTGDR